MCYGGGQVTASSEAPPSPLHLLTCFLRSISRCQALPSGLSLTDRQADSWCKKTETDNTVRGAVMGSPGTHRWARWGVGKTSSRKCISTEPWRSAEAGDRGGQGKASQAEGAIVQWLRGIEGSAHAGSRAWPSGWGHGLGDRGGGTTHPPCMGLGGPHEAGVKTACPPRCTWQHRRTSFLPQNEGDLDTGTLHPLILLSRPAAPIALHYPQDPLKSGGGDKTKFLGRTCSNSLTPLNRVL